ncbi:diacylglycerol kinase iota-like [Tachypleus tridentatus]|uniref:diacylglycerol kinase iota-like n=1 Tax=Tachypleus tridentatus TaxID=6853 RepID=UPI003FD69D09
MLDMVDYEKGQTALHMAAVNKYHDICCMLVSAGASSYKMEKQGMTPSQLARSVGYEELALYLENSESFYSRAEEKETKV